MLVTPLNPEPSAQAPCTSTMVGLGVLGALTCELCDMAEWADAMPRDDVASVASTPSARQAAMKAERSVLECTVRALDMSNHFSTWESRIARRYPDKYC